MYHFVEQMSFPPKLSDSQIICGIPKTTEIRATNNIDLVTCEDCLKKIKRCHICSCFVPESEIDINDFLISCKSHKILAQKLTEDFFRKNPDFTKW